VAVRGPNQGAADQPLSLEASAASLRLDAPVGEASLSLRASAYEEERGSGLINAASKASGHLLSATLATHPRGGDYGWRLQAWRRESDLANSSAAVAADRSGTTPANEQYKTPATGWGANAALRRQLERVAGGRLEWEVGADARFNEGATYERFRFMEGQFTRDREAGGETSAMGLYGEASWANADWLVAGGLRLDGWRNEVGRRIERDRQSGALTLNDTDADRSGEVVSARLAARRRLGDDGWALRAAAYSGFRPATLNELHRPFRVGNDLTEANAALVPETLKGVELGLNHEGEASRFGGTLFWNQIEDAIVNVTLAEGPGTFPRAGFVPAGGVLRQRQNAGQIEAWGIELSASHSLSPTLELQGALSATKARMDGGQAAPQLTGLRPAQAPALSATLGLDWQASERLGLGVQARYEARRYDDDLNSRVLDPALTIDARADWQLTARTSVWLAADNMLDEDIEVSMTGTEVAGYGPPRTLRLGIRLTY
jgi:outer membrane receptor protein involved in Fe transport